MRRLTAILAILVIAVLSRPVRAQEWPAVFDPFTVRTLYIQIDPAKWNQILHDTNFYDPVLNIREPCLLWTDGPVAPNSLATAITVQIRRKSDPALPSEANPQKVSLKIDVNEYTPGQELLGLKKISLENGSGNGVLKEGFAMNLHRLAADAGFYDYQGFYAAWVRLVVNGSYVGLYTSPEQRDVTFLKNRGMYRQGASWLYEVNGGLFLDPSVATANSPTHDHLNYLPFRSPNTPPPNFESDTQAWVDVRSMLTMAAIEAWMSNTDGLFTKSAANQGKNSFCVDWLPSLQRRRFYLPWDLDGGFSNTTWNIFSGGSGSNASRQYQRQFLDHYWFGQVYRQIFTELLDGPMHETALNAWLDQLSPVLGPALAEDPNASADFTNLRSFIAARNANVRTQIGGIIQPPVLSENGGEFSSGLPLAITHANTTGTSTIYYTLDGTDPRASGGAPAASALAYSGALNLTSPAHITARVRNVSGATTTWSNLRPATFNIAASLTALRITELMPRPPGAAGFEDADEFEFIELKNTGAAPLRLDGCRMSGVDFSFAPGTSVPAGGFIVLVANPVAFAQRYPAVAIHGAYFKNLGNTGERLAVVNSDGTTIDEVEYELNPPWPVGADGLGYSMVRTGAGEDASNWRASTALHGSPGADDPAPPYGVGLVINEVLAKTNTPLEDAIEIFNPTGAAIDISGWWLSDDYDPADATRAALKKYRIPAGTVVPAGGFKVIYEADFNPAAATANALVPFGLSQAGDAVYLSSADAGGALTGHIIGERFGPSEDGVAFGRFATGDGVDFTALAAHTFGVNAPASKAEFRTGTGAANAGARVGPVVISEIMYQPAAGGVEFIELKNVSASAVNLAGWMLEGASAFTFPAGANIAAGGCALVVDTTEAAFRAANSVPAGVPVFGATFDLGDGGESIELKKPNPTAGGLPVRIERVRYNDKAPWPVAAAGAGASIERITATAFGNDPLNWRSTALAGTPGTAPAGGTHLAIARGGRWNFHARNRDLGTAWRGANYRDGGWPGGPAPLGAGIGGLATALPYGATKPPTTYLRKDFSIPDAHAQLATLTLLANYNDGFIAYLNGTEIARRSLPGSGVTFTTPATPHAGGIFETLDLSAHKSLLAVGKNTLAIELHLTSTADTDALWDAELTYTLATTNPDADNDGIPDAWELAHGLDPNDATGIHGASGDPDGDGHNNLLEYRAGTDPRNPASFLRFDTITNAAGTITLTFSARANRSYTLQRSADLQSWADIATHPAQPADHTATFTDPAVLTRQFYRLAPSVP